MIPTLAGNVVLHKGFISVQTNHIPAQHTPLSKSRWIQSVRKMDSCGLPCGDMVAKVRSLYGREKSTTRTEDEFFDCEAIYCQFDKMTPATFEENICRWLRDFMEVWRIRGVISSVGQLLKKTGCLVDGYDADCVWILRTVKGMGTFLKIGTDKDWKNIVMTSENKVLLEFSANRRFLTEFNRDDFSRPLSNLAYYDFFFDHPCTFEQLGTWNQLLARDIAKHCMEMCDDRDYIRHVASEFEAAGHHTEFEDRSSSWVFTRPRKRWQRVTMTCTRLSGRGGETTWLFRFISRNDDDAIIEYVTEKVDGETISKLIKFYESISLHKLHNGHRLPPRTSDRVEATP